MKELIRKILREQIGGEYLSKDSSIVQAILSMIPSEYEGIYMQPWEEDYLDYYI